MKAWIPISIECTEEGCGHTLPTHVGVQIGKTPGSSFALLGGLPPICVDAVKIAGTDWEVAVHGHAITARCPAHKTKPGESG